MATNNLSSTIVFQLLRNKDNYANWCAWMKNYLLAQDLWDVVKEPRKLDKAWTKNNAAALHVILISCEADIVTPEIREITSAKTLWNKLASLYGPDNSSSIPNYSSSNISGETIFFNSHDSSIFFKSIFLNFFFFYFLHTQLNNSSVISHLNYGAE
jgi:hypothetical protein